MIRPRANAPATQGVIPVSSGLRGGINTDIPVSVRGDVRRGRSAPLGEGGAAIGVRTTDGLVRIQRF
jgi:hypothetical protein